jgi:hypothetical protein
MRLRFLLPLLLAFASLTRATTVVPPTFPELVGKADAIYRGHVTNVEARWVDRADGGGKIIKTFVTVAVERVLKGADQPEVTLEFLGGTVGNESLTVSGMPKFKVGQREIVFVQKNGVQFCPLVAMMHGRYRVNRDDATGSEFIARDNGTPLTDVSDVELPLEQVPAQIRAATARTAAARGLTPAAFEASVVSEVQRPTRATQPN